MIYLARHGQTMSNNTHTWQGQSGNDGIDGVGNQQAEKLADFFVDKDVKHIFASPLKRASETADKVAEKLGLKFEKDDLLIEMNYGEFEGMTMREIEESKFSDLYRNWKSSPKSTQFPGGESFEDLLSRAERIIEKYFSAEENILLVSHEDMVRGIIVAVSARPNEFWIPDISNTSITTFENVGGRIETISVGQTPHLDVY